MMAGQSRAATRYTGSGYRCYADSLHMCLHAAGAAGMDLPGPDTLECLTTMPFGAGYLRLDDGIPLVMFSPITIEPDSGLTRALDALGWTCRDWHGSDGDNGGDEALARLREATARGPVLVGPLDVGYLSYRPDCRHQPDGDHFVVALAVEDDHVVLHDPGGYPYAVIPTADFLTSWRAESIDWKHGAYRMRYGFQPPRHADPRAAIARTLPLIRANLSANPGGPVAFGGITARRMIAADLRGDVTPGLRQSLVGFVLPLAARRSLGAVPFFREAGRDDAARIVDQQAALCGRAQTRAVQRRYGDVARIVDQLADLDAALAAAL